MPTPSVAKAENEAGPALTYLVRNARVDELRNVRRLLVPQGAELQHEVRDFENDSGDPLVAWVDLKAFSAPRVHAHAVMVFTVRDVVCY